MPTNRTKRVIKRRVQGTNRALVEKLLTGHWWEFLVPGDEDRQEPDEDRLRWYWEQNREAFLVKYSPKEIWAHRYFEGDYRDFLQNWESWIKTDLDRQAVAEGCWFDYHAGNRVVTFYRRFLRHSKGQFAGQPFELARWQRDELIMPFYGWKRRSGTRRFRQVYCEIPKKNGKSTLCSGLDLYHLVGDGEFGAEVYSAANDREQASIVFDEAKHMVQSSPVLSQILNIVDSKKEINFHRTASKFVALSSDVPTKEGLNISAASVDELHAHRSSKLFDTLRYGGASRRQPMLIVITTAGEERKGICWEQHEYAEKVRSGLTPDISFLPLIYGIDEARDIDDLDYWTTEEAWRVANPSLGETIGIEQMGIDCMEARESPRKIAEFKRYRLNLWGQKSERWLPMDKWNACTGEGDMIPIGFAPQREAAGDTRRVWIPDTLIGRECYAGLDLASRIDIAALTLDFPLEDGTHAWIPFFWVPKEGAYERQRKDRVFYVEWANHGFLEMTEGSVTNYDVIRERIRELGELVNLKLFAVDRWNSTQLQTQIKEDGFEVVEFGQGMASMAAPCRDLEALIISEKLLHGNHPVLKWMASNVVIKRDAAGNIKPDKEHSAEKIDGIVAGIMGFDCANRMYEPEIVYDGNLMVI